MGVSLFCFPGRRDRRGGRRHRRRKERPKNFLQSLQPATAGGLAVLNKAERSGEGRPVEGNVRVRDADKAV